MRIGLAALCLLGGIAGALDPPVPPEMAFAPLPFRAPEPPGNPSTPAKVALGRLLFFDPILSTAKTMACATCHQPDRGWTDGRATAMGSAPLQRNTLTVLNVGFNTDGIMFWDNREKGLEAQSLHPIRSEEEMRGHASGRDAAKAAVERLREIPAYRAEFEGDITVEKLTQAIAAFERSLVTADTPFDRFLRGDRSALNPQQQRGMEKFTRAGCQHCHGGPMLSDFKLHLVNAPGERQAFRTPSLRNLAHTAPYMHNGRLRTLDEVLVFYDQLMDEVSETIQGGDSSAKPPLDPLLKALAVRPDDYDDLKAFLLSMSAADYDRSAPKTMPSGLKPGGE